MFRNDVVKTAVVTISNQGVEFYIVNTGEQSDTHSKNVPGQLLNIGTHGTPHNQ